MKNNKDFVTLARKFFWALCLVIVLVIGAVILNVGFRFSWWFIFVFVFVGISIWLCVKYRDRIMDFVYRHKKMMRIIGLTFLVVGVVLRFSFLLIQDRMSIKDTLSDTGVHWYGAQQLVDAGEFNKEIGDYESLFPYLFTYTGSLAAFMKILGKSYLAVVALNVVFDIIGAIGIYLLFKKWKKSKDVGLFAAVIWALNPLEIVFCGLPLAIVAVNVLFILAAFSMHGICCNLENKKKLCLYTAMLGFVLAIGNAYRPFFVIFAIATMIYLILRALKNKMLWKPAIMSMLIILMIMVVGGALIRAIHSHFNSYYDGRKSQAGWSVYVGANYDTRGKWSSDDRDVFFGPILNGEASGDVSVGQSIIMEKAIWRYEEIISHRRLISHFLNKTEVIFGDVRNAIYDVPIVFGISTAGRLYKLLQDVIMIFYLTIFGLFFCFVLTKTRCEGENNGDDNDFSLLLVISFIGFFLAMLLMESMNRYSLPFITLMLVLAVGFMVDVAKTPRTIGHKA